MNDTIQVGRPSVTELVNKLRAEEYFIDRNFQRRLVWTEKQKVRLIETILMGYPMPEIYVWEQEPNAETGAQTFSVVDGQQRLNSIEKFIGNEFPLKKSSLDSERQSESYAGKRWRDLSNEEKTSIWNYVINVRRIPSSVSEKEIRAIFQRLNETDKSLNPQELRNARFDGLFLTAAVKVADNPFWKKWELFSLQTIRRMGDIEFASSLLIYLRAGITGDTPTSINDTYDKHNDRYPEREKDIKRVEQLLRKIDRIFARDDEVAGFFSTTAHLYTLFVVLDQLELTKKRIKTADIEEKLSDFVRAYTGRRRYSLIEKYRVAVSSRTRSKQSREARVYSLVDWINR
ncbi:MAG: DUF262 domain-containing protein [Parvibaculum sp.]|uniref:DUF262 domain-containing protein n=1 Tax=Parvibaculum sp. TaxID=2024848 RepID=UPI003263DCE5